MQVGHGLPAIGSVIDDHAESASGQPLAFCDGGGGEQEMSEQGGLIRRGFADPRDNGFWNDEKMHRGLRTDVADGHATVIFMENPGGDFPGDDFLEERHESSN